MLLIEVFPDRYLSLYSIKKANIIQYFLIVFINFNV